MGNSGMSAKRMRTQNYCGKGKEVPPQTRLNLEDVDDWDLRSHGESVGGGSPNPR